MNEEIFIITDQPSTCPICGVRVEWEEVNTAIQLNACFCKRCNYHFFETTDDEVCPFCGAMAVKQDIELDGGAGIYVCDNSECNYIFSDE